MAERVVESGLRVEWEPNVPDAVMICDDRGRAALALAAHPDDPNRDNLVLVWSNVEHASLGGPNDEAIQGHPLWASGLGDVRWLGIVKGSALIRALATQNSVHPDHDAGRYDFLEHYIAPLKECVAEVIASSVETQRHGGSTFEAAATALNS